MESIWWASELNCTRNTGLKSVQTQVETANALSSCGLGLRNIAILQECKLQSVPACLVQGREMSRDSRDASNTSGNHNKKTNSVNYTCYFHPRMRHRCWQARFKRAAFKDPKGRSAASRPPLRLLGRLILLRNTSSSTPTETLQHTFFRHFPSNSRGTLTQRCTQ